MRIFKSISFFFLGFISIGLLFEVLLRLGGIMVPMFTIDPDKGERYFPDKMCCSLFNYEGFGLAKTNSLGWFGNTFKDSGTADISFAVLGNSFIAARQVFYRDNFLSLSQKKFHEQNLNFHLYNFGKETMPLRESLFIKEEIDSIYKPNYFVIFINERSFGNEGRYIPYYELVKGALHLNTDFKTMPFVKQYEKFKLLSKSSLLFLLFRVKNHLPDMSQILLDKFYIPNKDSIEESPDCTIDPVDEAVIARLAKDKRVVFLLDIDPVRRDKIKSIVANSLLVDIKPVLLKLQREQGIDPYYWKIDNETGHWNHAAHKVIAEEFTKRIENMIQIN